MSYLFTLLTGDGTRFMRPLLLLANIPATAHILGGTAIGSDASTGVIDSDMRRRFGFASASAFNGNGGCLQFSLTLPDRAPVPPQHPLGSALAAATW
jgi:hypothetical protein